MPKATTSRAGRPSGPRRGRPSGRLALAAVALFTAAGPALAAEELNRIILRVNDEILTLHDYEKRKEADVEAILADPQLSTRERQDYLGELAPRILQDMFRELLLMSRAKQLRLFISDQEVEAAIQDLAKNRGIEDQATFLQALQSSGMTLDQLREKMRREMTWSQVVGREVTSQIQVGEEELRAFYRNNKEEFQIPEKRWLKEVIVLESSGKSGEELAELAAEVRDKLAAGGELEAVIEPYQSAELTTGVIDLDWLTADELDDTLSEAAFQLEPGAFSEPIASRGGLHIIHLAGLEEAKVRPFEDVQDVILGRERSRRFDQELRNYLGKLERTAYIREDIPAEAVGYRSLAADYDVPEKEIQLFRERDLPAPKPAEETKPAESTE